MFKAGVSLEGLDRALQRELTRIDKAAAKRIKDGTDGLKSELRADTARALGPRIAAAWQSRFYEEDKAGFVYTKTPKIIAFNMSNAVIRPISGRKFLAIPTSNVPRQGRYRRRMTPEQVEHTFNQDLILLNGRRGSKLGFIEAIRAASAKRPGVRPATKGRIAKGRAVERILMFIFVPWIVGRKVIDPDAAFDRWSKRVGVDFENDLAEEG